MYVCFRKAAKETYSIKCSVEMIIKACVRKQHNGAWTKMLPSEQGLHHVLTHVTYYHQCLLDEIRDSFRK